MKQLHTEAIVLTRTNYGEADRIITVLTPESGKLSLVARGVRRPKSKMAGGIELFSVSTITYITGRGELGTTISTRLEKHYGNIVKSIDRVQLGYELIKMLHRATEDAPEPEYFQLLEQSFAALDDLSIHIDIIHHWFITQLVQLAGHAPNLQSDVNGDALASDVTYSFDYETASFHPHEAGAFSSNHIKFMRLAGAGSPRLLQQVSGAADVLKVVRPAMQAMLTSYIRQ